MSLLVREADLGCERQVVVDTLFRYLTAVADVPRFEWLYMSNPVGQARVWLAVDTHDHAIVGMASAFPRRIWVGEREELAWVLGDFVIDAKYRSLGPALQLQRACLAAVDAGAVACCYDFPTAGMMAVYKRLGVSPLATMVRLAKPLRVDRKARELFRDSMIRRAVTVAGNFLLTLGASRSETDGNVTLSVHEGKCGEEFSRLARDVGGRYGVCIYRSAEYLNWRYLASTSCRYELLTAHRGDVLLGYAIFTHGGEDAALVDLFGVEDPGVICSLVERAVALLRERGVVAVSVPMLQSHPWIGLLHNMGFVARETKPVVIYGSRYVMGESSSLGGMTWFLMHGDRDC